MNIFFSTKHKRESAVNAILNRSNERERQACSQRSQITSQALLHLRNNRQSFRKRMLAEKITEWDDGMCAKYIGYEVQ